MGLTLPELNLGLDPGEQEAISLAMEIGADAILMDERQGRAAAAIRHLSVIGTLGILDAAASGDLIDLPDAMLRLCGTSFRVDKRLIETLLAQDAIRRKQSSYVRSRA